MGGSKGLAVVRALAILVREEEKKPPGLRFIKGDRTGKGVDTSIFDRGSIALRTVHSDASLYLKLLSPGSDMVHVRRECAIGGLHLSATCSSEVRYERYDHC